MSGDKWHQWLIRSVIIVIITLILTAVLSPITDSIKVFAYANSNVLLVILAELTLGTIITIIISAIISYGQHKFSKPSSTENEKIGAADNKPVEQLPSCLSGVVEAYGEVNRAKVQPQNAEKLRQAEAVLGLHFGKAEQYAAARDTSIGALRLVYERAKTTRDQKLIEGKRKTLVEAVVRYAALTCVVNAYQEVQVLKTRGTKNQGEITQAQNRLYKAIPAAEKEAVFAGKREDIVALRRAYVEARKNKSSDVQQREEKLIEAIVQYAAKGTWRKIP